MKCHICKKEIIGQKWFLDDLAVCYSCFQAEVNKHGGRYYEKT